MSNSSPSQLETNANWDNISSEILSLPEEQKIILSAMLNSIVDVYFNNYKTKTSVSQTLSEIADYIEKDPYASAQVKSILKTTIYNLTEDVNKENSSETLSLLRVALVQFINDNGLQHQDREFPKPDLSSAAD